MTRRRRDGHPPREEYPRKMEKSRFGQRRALPQVPGIVQHPKAEPGILRQSAETLQQILQEEHSNLILQNGELAQLLTALTIPDLLRLLAEPSRQQLFEVKARAVFRKFTASLKTLDTVMATLRDQASATVEDMVDEYARETLVRNPEKPILRMLEHYRGLKKALAKVRTHQREKLSAMLASKRECDAALEQAEQKTAQLRELRPQWTPLVHGMRQPHASTAFSDAERAALHRETEAARRLLFDAERLDAERRSACSVVAAGIELLRAADAECRVLEREASTMQVKVSVCEAMFDVGKVEPERLVQLPSVRDTFPPERWESWGELATYQPALPVFGPRLDDLRRALAEAGKRLEAVPTSDEHPPAPTTPARRTEMPLPAQAPARTIRQDAPSDEILDRLLACSYLALLEKAPHVGKKAHKLVALMEQAGVIAASQSKTAKQRLHALQDASGERPPLFEACLRGRKKQHHLVRLTHEGRRLALECMSSTLDAETQHRLRGVNMAMKQEKQARYEAWKERQERGM